MNDNRQRRQDRGVEEPVHAENVRKRGWIDKIPPVVKALFIKFWFAGAMFLFFGMGLSIILDPLDLALVLGLALGLVSDLLINRILAFCEDGSGRHLKYALLYNKKFYFVVLNLIYGLALAFAISYTYQGLNLWIINARGLSADSVPLPAEPLLYGAFFALYDFILLSLKWLGMYIIKRIKKD